MFYLNLRLNFLYLLCTSSFRFVVSSSLLQYDDDDDAFNRLIGKRPPKTATAVPVRRHPLVVRVGQEQQEQQQQLVLRYPIAYCAQLRQQKKRRYRKKRKKRAPSLLCCLLSLPQTAETTGWIVWDWRIEKENGRFYFFFFTSQQLGPHYLLFLWIVLSLFFLSASSFNLEAISHPRCRR